MYLFLLFRSPQKYILKRGIGLGRNFDFSLGFMIGNTTICNFPGENRVLPLVEYKFLSISVFWPKEKNIERLR